MHINDVYAIRQILEDLHFTPKKDVSRVNAAIEARNVYPLGPAVQLTGGVFWLIAAIWMKDKPLIVTNGVMTVIGLTGLWSTMG
jgi:hypothetical protein